MSYDLAFWRYERGDEGDHGEVYKRLSRGERVEGVALIRVEEILARVKETFHDWERLDDATYDGGEKGGFEVFSTPQFFRVDCHGMAIDYVNRLIDIAHEFGCQLYDPQLDRRFGD